LIFRQPDSVILRDHSTKDETRKQVGCRECRLKVIASDIVARPIIDRSRDPTESGSPIYRAHDIAETPSIVGLSLFWIDCRWSPVYDGQHPNQGTVDRVASTLKASL
jgi:hypothetical protein